MIPPTLAPTSHVWINENRFRIVRQIGEGGSAFVFLAMEVVADGSDGLAAKKSINPFRISDHGTYAMKKVIIQTKEQLELVKQEIRVSSQLSHPNLLPLLDHAIIPTKLFARLKHMHSFDPPYTHNDVKPGNVLISQIKGQPPVAILMDFGSTCPAREERARKEIRSRSEALQLQELGMGF